MIHDEPIKRMTQQKLFEERKANKIPDPSYDLDGDGIVCDREYFLAKCFDHDRDGKLNKTERSNALKALKGNYEENFVWNVEETGPFRGQRLLQVRGKFIDGEGFLPVTSTYPKHPLSNIVPNAHNQEELRMKRKEEIMTNLKKSREEWEKVNPISIPQEYKVSEFLVDNPK